MAKVIIEVDVNWSNGQEITDRHGRTYWTGPIPIIDADDDEPDDLSFQGWVNLKAVEDGKLTPAEVYVWTSEDRLVRMSMKKKPDNSYKYRFIKLLNSKAQAKKDDLDPDNNGGNGE